MPPPSPLLSVTFLPWPLTNVLSILQSVLELEAAVQRDPTDALRWYELGVKQQENEREQKAVQALRRALELEQHAREGFGGVDARAEDVADEAAGWRGAGFLLLLFFFRFCFRGC